MLGFLGTCSSSHGGPWWLLGVTGLTGSSSGKEPGDRGTSLAVPQLGHQEPFLGDIAGGGRIQTSKDTAFVCPAALGSPSLISRLIFTFPSLSAQANLETGRAENQGGKGWMGS